MSSSFILRKGQGASDDPTRLRLSAQGSQFAGGLVSSYEAIDRDAASKRAKRLASAGGDLVRLHCEMVKELQINFAIFSQTGKNPALDDLTKETLDGYVERMANSAGGAREAVTRLYGDLSANPEAQICLLTDVDAALKTTTIRTHFLTPFMDVHKTDLYLYFMQSLFEKAGLSLIEPLTFGKIDLAGTWVWE